MDIFVFVFVFGVHCSLNVGLYSNHDPIRNTQNTDFNLYLKMLNYKHLKTQESAIQSCPCNGEDTIRLNWQ